MADSIPPNPPPPHEVLVEFLHALGETVGPYDRIVPVVRGSTLLQHWFGNAARPAADIDLEWFPEDDRPASIPDPIEHARRLCMHAISNHERAPIVFDADVPVPNDGVNLALWEYDTPGVRCYTGWRWDDRNLTGFLQIDIAQAGSYDLAAIATEDIELPRSWGKPAKVAAYSQEMLLAAKLSWIVRDLRKRMAKGKDWLAFDGEPKDLFDAHLLLTKGTIRADVFQNAFLAVAMEDKLTWNQIDMLLDPSLALPEDSAEQLPTVIANLRPLLGDLQQHLPFLKSSPGESIDEANLLIYADWLEDRHDPRADFLREFCKYYFHKDRPARLAAASLLPAQPVGWLYHVFGGAERTRDLRKRLEFKDENASSQPITRPEKPWWRIW